MVAIFEQALRRIHPARPEVDRQHHLGAGLLAPARELVGADLVGLLGAPGVVEADRAPCLGPNAVFPLVVGNEVAAGIANQRNLQFANKTNTSPRKPSLSAVL
jgi:hypothetical protein